jgi:uncharacterized membrane protein YphA (DoxX/SURF4 family)
MKELFSNKYFLLASRFVLGFIFVYAGAEKISDPAGFADSIYNYKIFPFFAINTLTIIIPWIEVVSGLLLIFGIAIKENALIINIFLIGFIVLITVSLFRGLNIDCGCFGTEGGDTIGIQKIVEDVLLLLLGIQIFLFPSEELTLNSFFLKQEV